MASSERAYLRSRSANAERWLPAGVAAGAGLTAAGLVGVSAGRSMSARGADTAAGMDDAGRRYKLARENADELEEMFRRLKKKKTKDGSRVWWDPKQKQAVDTKLAQPRWKAARASAQEAARDWDAGKRGLSQMRRGKLLTRGGLVAAGVGGLAAVGSVAGIERRAARRAREADAALRPPPEQAARPAAEYRALESSGGLLADRAGNRVRPVKPVNPKQREYLVRHGLADADMSDAQLHDVLRRARLNGA